jgi:hypothetical protein
MNATRISMLASLVLAFAVTAPHAQTQTLYKLIAKDGKVTYSDSPPKNFDGQVIKVEIDPNANTATMPKYNPNPPPARLPTAREAQRENLDNALKAARQRLEDAKKALEVGPVAEEGDVQIVQGPARATALANRSNCRSITREGKSAIICPSAVGSEALNERQRQLEDDVLKAEKDVEEAERAFRRGTD